MLFIQLSSSHRDCCTQQLTNLNPQQSPAALLSHASISNPCLKLHKHNTQNTAEITKLPIRSFQTAKISLAEPQVATTQGKVGWPRLNLQNILITHSLKASNQQTVATLELTIGQGALKAVACHHDQTHNFWS